MSAVLAIPQSRQAPPADLEVRPKAFKAWVDALPLAETLDSSRKLGGYLAQLNGVRLSTDARVELLEACRAQAQVLLDELDDIYMRSAQPLGPRGREALANARALAGALATGYQIAAHETAGKRVGFGLRKQLATHLVLACRFVAAQVIASYKGYSPVPAGTWSALHQIYLYAEQQAVVNDPGQDEGSVTVAQIYCETLLVSLTDAYRLVPGEINRVVALIRAMRAPVTLGQKEPTTRPGGHFLVPCDTDRGPKPELWDDDDPGGPHWRVFDANAIVDRLRQRMASMDEDAAQLADRLVVLWGDPPKRASRRDPSDMTVAVCLGIKAIAHYVTHDARVDAPEQDLALRKGITIQMPALQEDEGQRLVPIYEWEVVNQSTGGLRVRRPQGPAMQAIAVGEMVGIRAPGRPSWTLGVVRWITTLDDGGAEFGLQYVGTAQRAVWVQASIGSTRQSKPGLLVTDEASPASSILAVPPSTYSELREFDLQAEGYSARVRAGTLIEQTGRFDLFHLVASAPA